MPTMLLVTVLIGAGGGQGGIHWMKKNSNPKFAALKQETDAVIYIYIYIDLGPRYSVRRKVPKSPDN